MVQGEAYPSGVGLQTGPSGRRMKLPKSTKRKFLSDFADISISDGVVTQNAEKANFSFTEPGAKSNISLFFLREIKTKIKKPQNNTSKISKSNQVF